MNKLAHNCGKVEEIKHLEKFIDTLGEESYLASILSPKLVEWLKQQINIDCEPDIMSSFNLQKKNLKAVTEQRDNAKIQLSSANSNKAVIQKNLEQCRFELADKKAAIETYKTENIELGLKTQTLKNAINEYGYELQTAKDTIKTLKSQITDLKVDSNNTINNLQTNITTLENDNRILKDKNKIETGNLSEAIRDKITCINNRDSKIILLEADIKNQKFWIEQLTDRSYQLEVDRDELKDKAESLQSRLRAVNIKHMQTDTGTKISDLNKELEALKYHIEAFQTKTQSRPD